MVDEEHCTAVRLTRLSKRNSQNLALLMSKAGTGFIQKQDARPRDQGARNLSTPLYAIRKFTYSATRDRQKILGLEGNTNLFAPLRGILTRRRGQAGFDIFCNGKPVEEPKVLKCADQTMPRASVTRHLGNVASVVKDAPAGWEQHAGQAVHERCLARTVGAEHPDDFGPVQRKINAIQCHYAGKIHMYVDRLKSIRHSRLGMSAGTLQS